MRAKPAQWGSEGWDHVPETLNRVLSVVMFIFIMVYNGCDILIDNKQVNPAVQA